MVVDREESGRSDELAVDNVLPSGPGPRRGGRQAACLLPSGVFFFLLHAYYLSLQAIIASSYYSDSCHSCFFLLSSPFSSTFPIGQPGPRDVWHPTSPAS